MLVLPALAPTNAAAALVLMIAGAPMGATLTTAYLLAGELVPEDRTTVGFALLTLALNAGAAAALLAALGAASLAVGRRAGRSRPFGSARSTPLEHACCGWLDSFPAVADQVAGAVYSPAEMHQHGHVLTDRLELRCPDPRGDLDDLFPIFSDPDGWWYDPGSRHIDPEQTRDWLTRAAARFETDGLSYWTVRRRDNGVIIGVGGAQRQRTRAWNLNYRVATAHQGLGFATEIGRAAFSAASSLDSAVPFIAWSATDNLPSRKVAERLGLINYGLAVDPSDDQPRLAYADRPIGAFRGQPRPDA